MRAAGLLWLRRCDVPSGAARIRADSRAACRHSLTPARGVFT